LWELLHAARKPTHPPGQKRALSMVAATRNRRAPGNPRAQPLTFGSARLQPEQEDKMKAHSLIFAALFASCLCVMTADAGQIYGISYTDVASGSSIDLTAAGTLDWAKWGNGEANETLPFAAPRMTGGTIINTSLTPLGNVPSGQTVELLPFSPVSMVTPSFSWTNGTIAEHGGMPVGTSVSETILPAQSSYPLGIGLSFQVAASASPEALDVYVAGFDTRMKLAATLSGGASDSLIASNAALIPVAAGNTGNNYFSYGFFAIEYAGAGQTLTINLTADDQSGIPSSAPQYLFRNAGVMAATVSEASVPEPSSLVLSAIGLAGLLGCTVLRRMKARG
jgi:hypothetical protein